MSPRDEVVCKWLGVAHTLDAGVHKARVAKVTEACGAFFCRDCDEREDARIRMEYNEDPPIRGNFYFSSPLCLSILLLLAIKDISSGQLMSLFLTVEEEYHIRSKTISNVCLGLFWRAIETNRKLFPAFNNQLLLVLDLQTLQCVIFIVQEGEVVLQRKNRCLIDRNKTFLLMFTNDLKCK